MSKKSTPPDTQILLGHLRDLKLPWVRDNFEPLATRAAAENWTPVAFLAQLIEGEHNQRMDRATQRRLRLARFPVLKTLDDFDWSWPAKINRAQAQDLFRLRFVAEKHNVLLLGGCGLGKTHLALALGYEACLRGHSVLYASAAEITNSLRTAHAAHQLKAELKRYLRPDVLLLDELGYIPMDKHDADLLFQVISQRYERGSIVLTTNKAFKDWPAVFHNDATVTSAILDRLLHHAETLVIEGKSYRMKERLD